MDSRSSRCRQLLNHEAQWWNLRLPFLVSLHRPGTTTPKEPYFVGQRPVVSCSSAVKPPYSPSPSSHLISAQNLMSFQTQKYSKINQWFLKKKTQRQREKAYIYIYILRSWKTRALGGAWVRVGNHFFFSDLDSPYLWKTPLSPTSHWLRYDTTNLRIFLCLSFPPFLSLALHCFMCMRGPPPLLGIGLSLHPIHGNMESCLHEKNSAWFATPTHYELAFLLCAHWPTSPSLLNSFLFSLFFIITFEN